MRVTDLKVAVPAVHDQAALLHAGQVLVALDMRHGVGQNHADHRIHMALYVAALAADGVSQLDNPACAAVSFPGFHEGMQAMEVVA